MTSDRTQFDYLLNAFERASQSDDPSDDEYASKRRALHAYVRDLEARATPPTPAPSGWIACSERMPPQGEEVLVWQPEPSFKGGAVVALDKWDEQCESPVSFYSATIPVGFGWDSGVEWEHITHWMPLPGAPGDAAPAPAAEALHDPRRSSETGTAKATHGPSAEQPASNRRDAAGSVAAGGDGGVPAAEAGPVAWAIRDAIDGAIIDVVMPDDDMLDELSPQHKTPLFAAPPPSAPEPSEAEVAAAMASLYRAMEPAAWPSEDEVTDALRAAAAARKA